MEQSGRLTIRTERLHVILKHENMPDGFTNLILNERNKFINRGRSANVCPQKIAPVDVGEHVRWLAWANLRRASFRKTEFLTYLAGKSKRNLTTPRTTDSPSEPRSAHELEASTETCRNDLREKPRCGSMGDCVAEAGSQSQQILRSPRRAKLSGIQSL